jgi:hypothetical protein
MSNKQDINSMKPSPKPNFMKASVCCFIVLSMSAQAVPPPFVNQFILGRIELIVGARRLPPTARFAFTLETFLQIGIILLAGARYIAVVEGCSD